MIRAATVAAILAVAAPPASYSRTAPAARERSAPVQMHVAEVVRSFPHDRRAFTEGLFIRDGRLFESTGENGRSSIREVDLATGKVLRQRAIEGRYFGEGITDWKDELVSLTWQDGIAFRWDLNSFAPKGQFTYPGEGWALTHDRTSLIMSDGTAEIRFLDPLTFTERRRIRVQDQGRDVERINELELIRGELWANVWMTDRIVRIDPAKGHVIGWIDLSAIVRTMPHDNEDQVLNGIAYDARRNRIYVTGKEWPSLFEIRLAPERKRARRRR